MVQYICQNVPFDGGNKLELPLTLGTYLEHIRTLAFKMDSIYNLCSINGSLIMTIVHLYWFL